MSESRDQTKRARFAAQLKALPAKPGVYIMRGDRGDVIYVGKAAGRSRPLSYASTDVTQYTRPSRR